MNAHYAEVLVSITKWLHTKWFLGKDYTQTQLKHEIPLKKKKHLKHEKWFLKNLKQIESWAHNINLSVNLK